MSGLLERRGVPLIACSVGIELSWYRWEDKKLCPKEERVVDL